MSGRLDGKVAIVVGAGQRAGSTIGNGRATALLFAREGARVLAVDRDLGSAEETVALIEAEGGVANAHQADITDEAACAGLAATCLERWQRIDVLHNNVGIGTGDNTPMRLTEEAWDRIFDVNAKGMWMTCKHVIPAMRAAGSGSIVNVSSVAAVCSAIPLAYKASKAAVNALTQALAVSNARHGIRVNAIMPGLLDTPMAIEGIAEETGVDQEDLRAVRHRMVPLRNRMGDAWDVAYAALYLASDEADFVTGAILPVDGGQSARVG
jgi:NAD(P)-dependent dehydrogenase (short-subunit alcohol dehydrogenase family)